MPAVDTAYVIGVIREREKELLEEDEYVRLIDAATVTEAVHSLSETPYGPWLAEGEGVAAALAAVQRYLVQVRGWLADVIDEPRVEWFIGARYDGLNAASALVHKQRGDVEPGSLSPLGAVPGDVWHSTLWHDTGWEAVPEWWERAMRDLLAEERLAPEVWRRVGAQTLGWMEHVAFTPLTRELVELFRERASEDGQRRPYSDAAVTAAQYEQQWDEQVMTLGRRHRLAPVGYDPVVAWWYAVELEAKTVRLLLSAKAAGLSTGALRKLRRSLFRSLAVSV